MPIKTPEEVKKEGPPLSQGLPPVIRHTIDLLLFAQNAEVSQLPLRWQIPIIQKIVAALRTPKSGNIREPWILANGLPSLRVFLLTKRSEVFAPSISNFPHSPTKFWQWLKNTLHTSFCPHCGKLNFSIYIELGKIKWAKVTIECGELRLEGNLKDEDLKGGTNEKTKEEEE